MIAAIVGVALAGCSKGENDKLTNAYTYDGKTFNIVYAKSYTSPGNGIQFFISPTVPAEDPSDEPDFFLFECPIEALGQLIKLHEPYDDVNWFPYVALQYNETEYWGGSVSDEANLNDLSGSDNRVKVTKNTGADNYTLEFAMTLNGKRIEGNYTGTFEEYGGWIY